MISRFSYWVNGKLYLSLGSQRWSKTLLELKGPTFKFDEKSNFKEIARDYEPTSEEIFNEVDDAFEKGLIGVDSMKSDEITFAGDGEPLVYLDTLLESASLIKESRHGVPLRVLTSGLVSSSNSEDVATSLKQAGIKHVSVALIADNPKSYHDLVKPTNGASFNDVCSFISIGVEAGTNNTFIFNS